MSVFILFLFYSLGGERKGRGWRVIPVYCFDGKRERERGKGVSIYYRVCV